MPNSYSMTINGVAVDGPSHIDVVNPATGSAFGRAPDATPENLDSAVAAARAAFPGWRDTAWSDRRAMLVGLSDAMKSHADELAHLFTMEQGRPLEGAMREIQAAAGWLLAVAQAEIPVKVTEDTDTRRVEVHHDPIGVVGAIVPWNFPVLLAIWKIAPALLTGNTMVLKPSPFTPLTMLRIGELSRGILPPGVFNVVTGGDALGPMMTSHAGIDKISFTGSTATGKRVMESASRDLKKITLELGGNDAAIIMPDVDVDAVAEQLFFGAFFNSAQICIATKRMYIHADIYDRLRDRLHAIAQAVPVGDGLQQGSVLGPVQNAPQYARVKDLLRSAEDSGLTLLYGKDVPEGAGYFVPVVLVDNPPEDARVVQEEAFGPILPLLKFDDLDEVIARANNSEYGLAGAVWSKDIEQAKHIARRLDTGTVWINQNLQTLPHTPFGGRKQSGMGIENGQEGLMEFTQPKAIYIPKG